jgi:hypothetical protein
VTTHRDVNLETAKISLMELPTTIAELPICNKSINSRASVIHEIRRREMEHWFSGLRQAELFIDEKSSALENFIFECRKQEREIRRMERQVNDLAEAVHPSERQQDDLEACRDYIELTTRKLVRSRAEVRDALMERDAAIQERDRILAEHPEATALTYQELQEMFTAPMLLERQARFIAARVWAAQNGLPEGVGESVFSLPPEQREALLNREAELRTGNQLTAAKSQALTILAALSEEDREKVLILAAHHVASHQEQQKLQEGNHA